VPEMGIWIYDISHKRMSRLAFDPELQDCPVARERLPSDLAGASVPADRNAMNSPSGVHISVVSGERRALDNQEQRRTSGGNMAGAGKHLRKARDSRCAEIRCLLHGLSGINPPASPGAFPPLRPTRC